MRWRGVPESENVEDRRGMGGGTLAIGGGLGTVVLVVLALLLGADPQDVLNQVQQSQPTNSAETGRPPGQRADDELAAMSRSVLAMTERVWGEEFSKQGVQYRRPTMVLYDVATPTACGDGQAAMGPFYCPLDQKVYLDLSFFQQLDRRFGAAGDFAQAYVIAHEIGHHVQNLAGTAEEVRRAQSRMDQRSANRLSVAMELQADCYAGVWANRVNASGQVIEPGDIDEAMRAAAAVGDDALQARTQGRIVPDAFTHGTSAQREEWFRRGFQGGRPENCNTFSGL